MCSDNLQGLNFTVLAALVASLFLIGACSDSSDNRLPDPDAVPMNQLQYLGTHNSYHIQPRTELLDLLLAFIPDVAPTLEYTHIPLSEQFESQGIRQIELDVFYDPQGGLYAERQEQTIFERDPASGIPELDEPGSKILHVQEIDYETTCYTFVSCLQEIRHWSDDNPTHLPIMILVEVKDEEIPDPLDLGFSVPLPIDAEFLDTIDAEIRSVFTDDRIILPADVQGDAVTLEQAVLENGWPLLSVARGKVMFALDNGGSTLDLYVEGHPSLEGRVLFVSAEPGTAEAAFIKQNNPLADPGYIEELVRLGYLVRTRADSDTINARDNDTTQRDAALASGAQFISTDYPVPNPDFSEYFVDIPGDYIARCNPVNPGTCTEASLSP